MTWMRDRCRQFASALRDSLPLRVLRPTLVLVGLLLIAGGAYRAGLIIGNTSPSVPRGLYRAAPADQASYITFCLGTRHRHILTYPDLCSPDSPDNMKLIKRIALRHDDGSLTVAGDTPRALDSRFLGPIRPEDIRGWWVPFLTEDMLPFSSTGKGR